jgi:hypothetical protein
MTPKIIIRKYFMDQFSGYNVMYAHSGVGGWVQKRKPQGKFSKNLQQSKLRNASMLP